MKKAIVLFSGGLDSILTAKILNLQNISVLGITFTSPFFSAQNAQKAAKELEISLKIFDITKDFIKILKKPKYGFGSQMNPCIDCKILMLKKAKEIMKKEKADFVATGEVLGERPFSQNKGALEIIEKESSLKGYLLRPLSAKLLPKTIPEKRNWINQKALLDIFGRTRKKQMDLAKKLKISWYPTPAGGCLLTDPQFAKKMKDLMEKYPRFKPNDLFLLKYGRHFWEGKIKIVIGREEKENEKIKELATVGDIIVEMKNYPGPTTLLRSYGGKIKKEILEKAKDLTKNYSAKARKKTDILFEILKIK